MTDSLTVTQDVQQRTAVGAEVAFPEWPKGAPDDLTDFNDLANWKLANGQA
jgi:putative DNA primase/helicase